MSEEADKWMGVALREARRGWGWCSPNPMVGAAIVRDGELLGAGYHRRAGEAHAEINALRAVPSGSDLSRATLYVTLEPCSTWGRTPPCCDAIVASGLRHVVIGCLDANPVHAGRALEILRQAGVRCECGVLAEECRRLNEHFFWRMTRGRPWVVLKMAMTLDGRIALRDGRSKWISGAPARERVQELRRLADVIMVGGATVAADDPGLRVVEPPDWPRQPRPVIWTARAVPSGLRLAGAETAKPTTRAEWLEFLEGEARRGTTVILLEGGGELAANALSCGVVNQVQFFIAPKILGGRDSRPVVGGEAASSLEAALRLREVRTEWCGEDLLYIGYPAGE